MAPLSNLLLYGAGSTFLSLSVIIQALNSRNGFYAAAVQIGRSSGAIMVLLNFVMFLTLCFGILLKNIFFGQLRPVEIEHLYDRAWFFFTESMLALTVFRDDFDAQFVLMFMMLLFLKCFHWICLDRVEYMDQVPPPGPPVLFHVRINIILDILLGADLLILYFCAMDVWEELSGGGGGSGGMVLFASEYAILVNTALTIAAKYAINVIDLRRAARMGGEDAPAWEEKSMWIFYVELTSDAVKLVTYSIFFYTIFTLFASLPINHLHSLYSTVRSFLTKLRDLMRYRAATRNMDERYPDATEEEVGRLGDGHCVICREEMVAKETRARRVAAGEEQPREGPNDTPKRLPCNHVLHYTCLVRWMERQQVCPVCRRTVLDNTPPAAAPEAAVAPLPNPTFGVPLPQPGQAAIPANGASASATTPLPAVQVPIGGPLGIWGTGGVPLHAPMGLAPRPTTSPLTGANQGWGPSGPPWSRSHSSHSSTSGVQRPGADYPPGPSRRQSSFDPTSPILAETPTTSQAPAVFSPTSLSKSDSLVGNETPAQLAAQAAMRRLQKMSAASSSGSGSSSTLSAEGSGRGEGSSRMLEARETVTSPWTVPMPPRTTPYLIPLNPAQGSRSDFPFAPATAVGRTPRAIISSLMDGFEELKGALKERYGSGSGLPKDNIAGSDVSLEKEKRRRELEEEMKDLEVLDRRLGESMDVVGRAKNTWGR